MKPLLAIKDLRVALPPAAGSHPLLEGISFGIAEGSCLALVGESGCGKSLTGQAILGLVPDELEVGGSRVLFRQGEPRELGTAAAPFADVRGREIGMIFQDPATSLNPVATVASQLELLLRQGGGLDRRSAKKRCRQLLSEVELPDVERVARSLPCELSGGMQQRVALALALALQPRLLVADEPTTALDYDLRRRILELLDRLRRQRGLGLLLISHDLSTAIDFADEVAVLYAGRIVEHRPSEALLRHPRHPYTAGLLRAIVKPGGGKRRLQGIPGRVPPPGEGRAACSFAARCPGVKDRCKTERPPFDETSACACWFPLSEERR